MAAERCFQGLALECETRRESHWLSANETPEFPGCQQPKQGICS